MHEPNLDGNAICNQESGSEGGGGGAGGEVGSSWGPAHCCSGREAGLLLGQQQLWPAGNPDFQGPEFPGRGQEPGGHARHPGGLRHRAHPLSLRVSVLSCASEAHLCVGCINSKALLGQCWAAGGMLTLTCLLAGDKSMSGMHVLC